MARVVSIIFLVLFLASNVYADGHRHHHSGHHHMPPPPAYHHHHWHRPPPPPPVYRPYRYRPYYYDNYRYRYNDWDQYVVPFLPLLPVLIDKLIPSQQQVNVQEKIIVEQQPANNYQYQYNQYSNQPIPRFQQQQYQYQQYRY